MHLKNENERNMFMHLENMMMIPFSAPSPVPTWPTYTLDTIAQINFHENCQQPNRGGEKENYSTILSFCIVFCSCFYYEKIFGIFKSFVLAIFASYTISRTLQRQQSNSTPSIFSTPMMAWLCADNRMGKIIFIMFYFLLLRFASHSIHFAPHTAHQFMVMRWESPQCFISFYDFI